MIRIVFILILMTLLITLSQTRIPLKKYARMSVAYPRIYRLCNTEDRKVVFIEGYDIICEEY